MDERYINLFEVIVNLFTFNNNKLEVLLIRKSEEPYKGYWMLPSNLLMTSETIEECAIATIDEMVGLDDIYLKECNVFSKIDRLPNERIIGNSLIGLIDSQTLLLKKDVRNYESAWFPIKELPKMVYDHGSILLDAINHLKKELLDIELMKKFFKSDFTLSELQSLFEQILDKKLDRRNFRKKIIKMDILEDTGDKHNKGNGRPAELFRFKEINDRWDIYE